MPLSACAALHQRKFTIDAFKGEKLHESIDVGFDLSSIRKELPEDPVEFLVNEDSCHLLDVDSDLLKILLAFGIFRSCVGH
jgi:hypothetical protein